MLSKRTLRVENIKLNRLIESTEDFEFIVNNKIRLYVSLENEFKVTILDKLKCPFTIFFEDEIIINNIISSSIDFEIIMESYLKPINGNTKIFSMDYNEFN